MRDWENSAPPMVEDPPERPVAGKEAPAAKQTLRVVAIGGGTGLSTLLRGLRRDVITAGETGAQGRIADLAAVVTVTDDGGSSGRLRKGFNMLPPGDLRNCMVALSEEEDLLAQLFNHRFRAGDALKGHNFGNLFVAALTEITGDFALAVELSSKILATRGRIYPATTANTTLVARMDDGSLVSGETNITASRRRIVELMIDPPCPAPLPETLEAIARADLITVVPGIERFAQEPAEVRPKLAISLNAPNDSIRSEVMPINRKWPIEAVVDAVRAVRLRPRERITFEYVLLGGVTDRPEHAREVARLVRRTGLPVKVNLIAWNPGPGIEYATPEADAVENFRRALAEEGIAVYLRKPRGRDIYAACGQLKRTVEG